MEDPFSSYSSEGESSGKIPTWVWVVGGLVLGGGCCLALIIGGLAFAGPQMAAVFDEIVATAEVETAAVATAAPAPTVGHSDGRLFGTAEAILQNENEPLVPEFYSTDFNEVRDWGTGDITSETDSSIIEANVQLVDGVFKVSVYNDNGLYWATAGEQFANGIYEIEATAVQGALDNGFGLIFMVDNTADDFYMFEISSDGYVWIGYYDNGGETIEPLVEDGWFMSDAVKQGLNTTNTLRVEANKGDFKFYVNNEEVAQLRDFKLLEGDVGVFVETLGEGDVVIDFDNFTYNPIQ